MLPLQWEFFFIENKKKTKPKQTTTKNNNLHSSEFTFVLGIRFSKLQSLLSWLH